MSKLALADIFELGQAFGRLEERVVKAIIAPVTEGRLKNYPTEDLAGVIKDALGELKHKEQEIQEKSNWWSQLETGFGESVKNVAEAANKYFDTQRANQISTQLVDLHNPPDGLPEQYENEAFSDFSKTWHSIPVIRPLRTLKGQLLDAAQQIRRGEASFRAGRQASRILEPHDLTIFPDKESLESFTPNWDRIVRRSIKDRAARINRFACYCGEALGNEQKCLLCNIDKLDDSELPHAEIEELGWERGTPNSISGLSESNLRASFAKTVTHVKKQLQEAPAMPGSYLQVTVEAIDRGKFRAQMIWHEGVEASSSTILTGKQALIKSLLKLADGANEDRDEDGLPEDGGWRTLELKGENLEPSAYSQRKKKIAEAFKELGFEMEKGQTNSTSSSSDYRLPPDIVKVAPVETPSASKRKHIFEESG